MKMLFELLTIAALGFLTLQMGFSCRKTDAGEGAAQAAWTVRALRLQPAKRTLWSLLAGLPSGSGDSAGLPLDSCFLGNGLFDDCKVDAAGPRIRLYLNVQEDQIWLTVLTGSIVIGGSRYRRDPRSRIAIHDLDRIKLRDIELEFVKKEIRPCHFPFT